MEKYDPDRFGSQIVIIPRTVVSGGWFLPDAEAALIRGRTGKEKRSDVGLPPRRKRQKEETKTGSGGFEELEAMFFQVFSLPDEL